MTQKYYCTYKGICGRQVPDSSSCVYTKNCEHKKLHNKETILTNKLAKNIQKYLDTHHARLSSDFPKAAELLVGAERWIEAEHKIDNPFCAVCEESDCQFCETDSGCAMTRIYLEAKRKWSMKVSEIKVTKIEKEVSPTEKKVIYDFGEDIEDYRYLIENWIWSKYSWNRTNMYWPSNKEKAEMLL